MAKRVAEAAADLGMEQGSKLCRMQEPPRAPSPAECSSGSDEVSNQCFYDAAGDAMLTTASSGGACLEEPAWGAAGSYSPSPAASGASPPGLLPNACHAEKGPRAYMEDAHAVASLPALGAWAGAVFDGHGGAFVAQYAADNLLPRLHAALAAAAPPEPSSGLPDQDSVKDALCAAFTAVDRELAMGHGAAARACGTTAAVALVTDELVFTAHCGDSRVLLVRPGRAHALTIDHSPMRMEERERVRKAGGRIVWQNGLRVMGALSMTRAIGDHFLRRHGVIADPEVSVVARSPGDEVLLLATDGLWNYVSSEEAAAAARRALARAAAAGLPRAAAAAAVPRALARLALARGGGDNVTVMVVDLQPPTAPAPVPAAAPLAPAALLSTAAAAPTPGAGPGPSPFQAPDLQLPHLNLPRIKTRPDPLPSAQGGAQQQLLGLLHREIMSRAASEPVASLGDPSAATLCMLRSASAPVGYRTVVTTGGPAVPAAPVAAEAPAAPAAVPPVAMAAAGGQHAWANSSCGAAALGIGPYASLPSCPVTVVAGGGDGFGGLGNSDD